jgi:hypothetical protein
MAKKTSRRALAHHGLTIFPAAVLLKDRVTLRCLPWRSPRHDEPRCVDAEQRVTLAGKLRLPSGRLVALDPLTGDDQKPIPEGVRPGTYEVLRTTVAAPDDEPRVAALTVRFRKAEPMEFRPGPTVSVDSATVAFIDKSVHKALFRLFDPVVPDPGYEKVWASGDGRLVLDKKTRADIISAPAGYGDGTYGTWRGYSESGDLTCVVMALSVVLLVEQVVGANPRVLGRMCL